MTFSLSFDIVFATIIKVLIILLGGFTFIFIIDYYIMSFFR